MSTLSQFARWSVLSQVTMTGGDEFAAKIVGFDADKDVAVLRLKLPDTFDRQATSPLPLVPPRRQ